MFALTRVLVPTNLGEPSKAAIRYGVAFARQFQAKLFLVHVLPTEELEEVIERERVVELLSPDSPPGAKAPSPDELRRNAAREDLGRLLDPRDEAATHAEYVLRAAERGSVGEQIVACARELGVELIVMGKHRLGFVEHLLAGSVTERVMQRAPCPVLTVQHPEHEFVVDDAPPPAGTLSTDPRA